MKENEIALTLINRIGINNFRDKNFVESIKKRLLNLEHKSKNNTNVSNNSNLEQEKETHGDLEKKTILNKESHRNKTYNIKDERPIQVQLLEHLIYLRNEYGYGKHDAVLKEDLKSRSLLVVVKNLINEFKKKSSWYSILDDKGGNDSEYLFEGIEELFGLLLLSNRLERYLKTESTSIPLLVNNVLLSFRYIFQSEKSNLSVIQHPEWAIEYLRDCVKKYMILFKKVKNDIKIDSTTYFKALIPEPYSDDYSLLEEFSLICKECSVDDIASSWCSSIAKEARLFVYSRLPFLVYDYFKEHGESKLNLTDLMKIINNPRNKTVLEVSRSSYSDEKAISVLYSLISSLVEFSVYLRSIDSTSSFDLFSDFDNNTIVPFIMLQIYNYNGDATGGHSDLGSNDSDDIYGTSSNQDSMYLSYNNNNHTDDTHNNDTYNSNTDYNHNNRQNNNSENDRINDIHSITGGENHNNNCNASDNHSNTNNGQDIDTHESLSDDLSKKGNESSVESRIVLCFESNLLYGCLDALLEMENIHTMNICKKVISLESLGDSIGVRTGLNTTLYLQDDQFFSQVSNILIAILKLVDKRCQCLKFTEPKKQYVALVVVPLIEYFIDRVKHIWNSLDNVLESCTISCLLLESATVLHDFLLKFPLSEFMNDALSSLDNITQKMVGIFDQYFVELYYDPFRNIHRHPLEIMNHITHKLLQICALSSHKNYTQILRTTLSNMEKAVISTLVPSKSMDFILMDGDDVETSLNNCKYILESVKKLVEPREYSETMQQVHDVVVILSMETVELKTSAEYLNLLGTGRISSKNNADKNNQEFNINMMNKLNTGDSFVSSIIFDDIEGDFSEDIHDSLIVSKIKQKLKVKKLTLSQTYTLIKHKLYATTSDYFPLDEAQHSF